MFFGFIGHQELIPEIYQDYAREELNFVFLCQYNANVEDDLKVPLYYARRAESLRGIFRVFLADLLCARFGKAKRICIQSSFYVQHFETRRGRIFGSSFVDITKIRGLLQNYFCGVCFKTQDLFIGYVYDKICKQNPSKSVFLRDNLITINQKVAILVCGKKANVKKLEACDEVGKALDLICKNSFSAFYIVYPKSSDFTHFVEIKHFLCDLNKTMLKLVPYSISNKLVRRI